MNSAQINSDLEAISREDRFEQSSRRLVAKWTEIGIGGEAVEPVLRFMERHPDIDIGSPGPLVHFIEQSYRAGGDEREIYVQHVLASVRRKPTAHTVWLLNRIINVAGASERGSLLRTLRDALNNPEADAATKDSIESFLNFQAGK